MSDTQSAYAFNENVLIFWLSHFLLPMEYLNVNNLARARFDLVRAFVAVGRSAIALPRLRLWLESAAIVR